DRLPHGATYNREVCDLPRQELLGHDADEIVRRRDGADLDRHDDIASDGNLLALELALLGRCNEAGTCSRRPCTDPADDGAARNREVKPARNSRREALCLDADEGVVDPTVGEKLPQRAAGGVDRHRKGDALGVPARALDLRADADDPPTRVEHRPTGVAMV